MLNVATLLAGTESRGDALRYGRASGRLPARLLHYSEDKKPVVVWTSTRRCNLRCRHCYTDSANRDYPGELTTAEALAMAGDLAAFGSPVLLISGGEPLTREDVFDVATRATEGGMRVVFSTNGTLITPRQAERLHAAGVSYVGISIDGRPDTHDRFRGREGAFAASMRAIEACRDVGIRTGLRFTLTKANQTDLPWLFSLMREREIRRLCVYHLAPTGRGSELGDLAPSAAETRAALDLIVRETAALIAEGHQPEILTADNHADNAYVGMRIAAEQPERAADVWRLLRWNGGNQSGRAIACIDADGTVYPDQFWRWRSLGNIREHSFREIWADAPSEFLQGLRDRRDKLPDRCQACRFVPVCNGNLRSRAEAVTGDLWGADPLCYLADEEIHGAPIPS